MPKAERGSAEQYDDDRQTPVPGDAVIQNDSAPVGEHEEKEGAEQGDHRADRQVDAARDDDDACSDCDDAEHAHLFGE